MDDNWDLETWNQFERDLRESIDEADIPRRKRRDVQRHELTRRSLSQNEILRPQQSLDSRMTHSTPSTPTHVRTMDNCFGKFDGVSYDLSGLSPVQALAKISAAKMLTTVRVGHPQEDPTMAVARPRLSEINRKGFLTNDSQMGKKEVREDNLKMQRSYIQGVMSKRSAEYFRQAMSFEDSVVVLVEPSDAQRRQGSDGMVIPVTYIGNSFCTNTPVTSLNDFDIIIYNILPEIKSIVSDERCFELVRHDAMRVEVVDTTWGRPFWLFDKVSEVLDRVNEDLSRTNS